MPTITLEPVTYDAGGQVFTGFLADGSGGALGAGVLVIHEGGGLNEPVRERARRLASHGFVAFAMDLFGPIEQPSPERPEAMARAREIVRDLRADTQMLRDRCVAALAVLQTHPGVDGAKLAAIGHCFGGAAAIELARTAAPLAAVVGFHSGIIPGTPDDNAAIRGKVLLCHGADDPVVPPEQIRDFCAALNEAGIDWQLHLYGGVGHSFTNPEIDAWGLPGFAYSARAEERSWAAMFGLFREFCA